MVGIVRLLHSPAHLLVVGEQEQTQDGLPGEWYNRITG